MAKLRPLLYLMGGKLAGEPTNNNLKYQALFTLSLPIIAK